MKDLSGTIHACKPIMQVLFTRMYKRRRRSVLRDRPQTMRKAGVNNV